MTYGILYLFEGKGALLSQRLRLHLGLYVRPSFLSDAPQLSFESRRTIQISLPFPQWQECFSGWLSHVDNIRSAGQEGKKIKILTPLPTLWLASPLACCFGTWASSKHTPPFGLWAAWETKENLSSKLDQVFSCSQHFTTPAGLLIST